MQSLGTIVRLQIQRSSLKTGVSRARVYHPAPLLPVSVLYVSPDGVFGLGPDGSWLIDIHHRAHPDSKNPGGENGISIGFSGHYDAMRERFGDRIELGCAGENIIAELPRRCTLDELRAGLVILSPAGAERLRLRVLDVAHPCKPFTGWALAHTVEPEIFKTHLQFLEDGTRGFLLATETAARISVGDHVAVLDEREAGSEKGEAGSGKREGGNEKREA